MVHQNETSGNSPVALVSGANKGIGFQVAKELAANGFTVLVGSRNIENGEAAAKSIGPNAHALHLDVTTQESIETAAKRIQNDFGRLDLLVNNAAISHTGAPNMSLKEMIDSGRASVASIDEVRAVFETNVFGVIAVTQAMLPILRKTPGARIVNVSSSLGSLTLNADPAFPYRGAFGVVYAASKTALNAITLSFAIELEAENISVSATSPGFTATALNNFEGTDTLDLGARSVVRVALDANTLTGSFSGPDGLLPW
ncbi:MAG TPA: SDR family NAD(P)-dependent oxidoreductase [Bacteroidales bacterium]|nr:SDR family NAD(P)-dependent oxidoreductase [Bacteroidales bacterium]